MCGYNFFLLLLSCKFWRNNGAILTHLQVVFPLYAQHRRYIPEFVIYVYRGGMRRYRAGSKAHRVCPRSASDRRQRGRANPWRCSGRSRSGQLSRQGDAIAYGQRSGDGRPGACRAHGYETRRAAASMNLPGRLTCRVMQGASRCAVTWRVGGWRNKFRPTVAVPTVFSAPTNGGSKRPTLQSAHAPTPPPPASGCWGAWSNPHAPRAPSRRSSGRSCRGPGVPW